MEHCKKNDNACDNNGLSSGIVLGTSDNDHRSVNNNIDIDNLVEGMNEINITDMSKCAACGKGGGGDNLKVCTACESVKYCNAKCRNAHRSKHKKECKQLAAERKLQNKIWDMNKMVISDDKLFADPPPKEDCPICMQPIPYAIGLCGVYTTYQPCCGKTICNGCVKEAEEEMEKGNLKEWCPFCRLPNPRTREELLERVKKRIDIGDDEAIDWLGGKYSHGTQGFLQDMNKAIKLYTRAAELGSVQAQNSLARAYEEGKGVEKDVSKAIYYYKVAAIARHEYARYALGDIEHYFGNINVAIKHYIISARAGHDKSLEEISKGYKAGHVAKDEYANTLRAHQDSVDEMKSEQRSVTHALRKLRHPE